MLTFNHQDVLSKETDGPNRSLLSKLFAQVTRSTWGTDPFMRGSYSYVSREATTEDVSTLGEP